jgi:hypothetical protein
MADDAVFTIETNLERWLLSVRRESGVRADFSDAGVRRAMFLDVREPAAFISRRLQWTANFPLREIKNGNAARATASQDALRFSH